MRRKRTKLLKSIGVYFIIFYLTLGITLRIGQTRLLFFPSSHILSTPAIVNLDYQQVEIPVKDSKLIAWWIPSQMPRRPTLLYLHGNASNLGDLVGKALIFHNLGLNTLLIDYRGYGMSDGPFPNETRLYEDVEAAGDYLTIVRQIPPDKIFVYGHSLGGAIAIHWASQQPNLGGVIIESSFTSIPEMLSHLFPVPLFPPNLILTQKFDSLSKISQIQAPILIMHGTQDSVIPVTMSKQLFQQATGVKCLVLFPGAGHNNISQDDLLKYQLVLSHFFEQKSCKK